MARASRQQVNDNKGRHMIEATAGNCYIKVEMGSMCVGASHDDEWKGGAA